MVRDFFLYHLTDGEFEDLVVTMCKRWLGEGTTSFAAGRDGGRDAKFYGLAQTYPSTTKPWNGHIVVQAKHTQTPNASCSDSDFKRYFEDGDKSEIPKVERLITEGILHYYMVFTNRKLTAGTDEKLLKKFRALSLSDAAIVGLEDINVFLHQNPEIARRLPVNEYAKPFDFIPDDMVEVITAVHDAIQMDGTPFSSADDFSAVNKKKLKNKVNRMSDAYYNGVIVNHYMPLFDKMRSFLQNERNREFREIYHDIADELRTKIIKFRDRFDHFEEIIIYLFDIIKTTRPDLRGKRRYVTFLLCYMYDDCDIGE
ncbi:MULTISPECIES: ABC-three component system protein, partial [Methylobacterium]